MKSQKGEGGFEVLYSIGVFCNFQVAKPKQFVPCRCLGAS